MSYQYHVTIAVSDATLVVCMIGKVLEALLRLCQSLSQPTKMSGMLEIQPTVRRYRMRRPVSKMSNVAQYQAKNWQKTRQCTPSFTCRAHRECGSDSMTLYNYVSVWHDPLTLWPIISWRFWFLVLCAYALWSFSQDFNLHSAWMTQWYIWHFESWLK